MPQRPRAPSADAVEVSRPDKLLWSDPEVSKRAYVAYLRGVSARMLPWLRRRPLTLVRAPDGVAGERYFQKSAPKYAPAWIDTVRIAAPSAKRDVDYVVCDDEATLAWLGNQAAIEFHPAPVRVDRLDRPDLLVVDIDPPDDRFDMAVDVAELVLDVLDDLGFACGVKTTGGKGLHVVAPIERRQDAVGLRAAAARLTDIVTERAPDLVTDAFKKQERRGRVMLDPSRNAPGATVVAPYSPRARDGATVSFPLVPAELRTVSPADFTVSTAAAEAARRPGPGAWDELVERRSRIPTRLLA